MIFQSLLNLDDLYYQFSLRMLFQQFSNPERFYFHNSFNHFKMEGLIIFSQGLGFFWGRLEGALMAQQGYNLLEWAIVFHQDLELFYYLIVYLDYLEDLEVYHRDLEPKQ
jgi:hypothetical protein